MKPPQSSACSIQSVYHDHKILVVDDAALNRELIISYLQGAGFKNLQMAVDGMDALDCMDSFEPDILILDLLMPKLNGIEVIKKLRSDPKYKQLPIIVQTSISDPEQRVDAWYSGATDVITKPIHKLELLSRVKVQLEKSYLIRALESYQTVASDDISQALEVQNSLLPDEALIQKILHEKKLHIDYLFIPSRFLSGDMWGVIDTNDDKLTVWICDFAGKGIRAALNTFRIHTLIREFKRFASDPKSLIQALNTRMVELMPSGQFATFFIGVIDQKKNTLQYTAASSTYPLIYYPQHSTYDMGDASGIPLGVAKDVEYPLRTLHFPPGASLILYSDMLWEDKGIPGISLLPERVKSFVHELNGRSFVDVIRQQVEMIGDLSLPDDLTLIEIQRTDYE